MAEFLQETNKKIDDLKNYIEEKTKKQTKKKSKFLGLFGL